MTDRKAARQQLTEWILKLHHHGQMQSQTDRDAYVAAWLAILDLAVNNVVDLSPPPPPKQDAFIKPLPVREVLDSPEKLAAARKKLEQLAARERQLSAMRWDRMEARHDAELRNIRNEIACLNVEVGLASKMTGAAHAG
jgi:hypothetical protein